MINDDAKKMEAYMALITEVFSKYGYEDSLKKLDPDKLGHHEHFIVRKEKGTIFGFFPNDKFIPVAKIAIEPTFSNGHSEHAIKVSKPEIRIIDKKAIIPISEFCKRYKYEFGQDWKLI